MQTDVKIGVVVGVLLAGAVIVYFVVGGGTFTGQVDQEPLGPGELRPPPGSNQLVRAISPKSATARPPAPTRRTARAATPKPAAAAKALKGRTRDVVVPRYAPKPADKTKPTRAKAVVAKIAERAAAVKDKPTAAPSGRDAVLLVPTARTPKNKLAPGGRAANRTKTRTYTFTKSDYGFWTVAEKVYGNGKYYYLIAKANPNVTSTTLRTGARLVIPPLPLETPTPVAKVGPAGPQRTYTVQPGDAGFWGISKKVYGQGKYFYLLRQANPGVNSTTLRPGRALIIPPKPTPTAKAGLLRPRRQPTGAAVPRTAGTGGKTYVVQPGDAGFWGIAEKVYGQGKYFYLLKQANPGAKSTSLRAGQTLIVPPLGAEPRTAARKTAPKPGPTANAGDDRPYFDEY